MRLIVHDFAGHAFPVQLSRELADRGHRVTHLYAGGLPGPKGRITKDDADAGDLQVTPVPLSGQFRKYSPLRRFTTQRLYASNLKRLIQSEKPDVVLSGNTPIDVQAELLWHCRRNQIGFVHWVQDVYCEALRFLLNRKNRLATPLAWPFYKLEQYVAHRSNCNVAIAPEFRILMRQWGIPSDSIKVVENWAPLNEISQHPQDNAWRRSLALPQLPVLLYSGTLGLKHRPDLIYLAAKELQGKCTVVVISEGVGRQHLETLPRLDNLVLLGFQPYDALSQVLASADVLLATLAADAGQFAVPSKVLSYLCAGRPILLAAPKENLAAAVVERAQAGTVIDPNDPAGWVRAARLLADDLPLRERFATNARAYAERVFNIGRITTAFEGILKESCSRPGSRLAFKLPKPACEGTSEAQL